MKHVLFDLDGTLGNTLPLCVAAFRAAIEPLVGRAVGEAEIVATFGPSEEGTLRALIPEHFDAGLAAYFACYEELHPQWPEPFPGVPELLRALKRRGGFLGLVTGKGPSTTELTLRQFGLADVFDTIATGSPEGPVKDQQVEEIIRTHALRRDEVAVVGDSPVDLAAARAAGVTAVAAAWAPTADVALLRSLQPDQLFTRVEDLASWLGLDPLVRPTPSPRPGALA